MAGGCYSERSIERVRAATDIVSVIGRYVILRRAGRSIKGLCPFHKEKTPSFFVSPDRQMYHCFGCGAGGDVFSFLMNYLNFSFTEAVEELAAEAGVPLEKTGRDGSRTDVFREILAESHGFYRGRLAAGEGRRALDYLASRSISEGTIRKLGVGWAPEGSELSPYLQGRGYSDSQLIEAGVSLRSTRGSGVYDRFRNRILFPICDRRGRVISFGGRLLGSADSRKPKYLNGPDSPIYSKGNHLYGYREAASASRDLDMVILVEGYFDHARFVEKGFDCAVATCGTALTPSQARQIGGMASSIYICYDGDPAGQRAAVRAAEVLLEEGYLPRIMALPDRQDPDDYLRDRPDEAVLELVSAAGDPIRYALGLLGGWSSVQGTQRKVRVVQRLASVASKATEPVIRETLMKVVSEETGYSIETIRSEMEEENTGERRRAVQGDGGTLISPWDRSLLAGLLMSPDGLADPLIDYVQADDLRSDVAASILEQMKRQSKEGLSEFSISSLEDEEKKVCAMIMSVHFQRTESEDRDRIMKALDKFRLQRERKHLRSLLRSGEDENPEDIRRRIAEIEGRLLNM
ncbi:MAG: hypothetical protein AVO35_05085 [Candidatus Aegiribacteria sp. MLS_C]|nr:MAG: hypothetical protein AVO35_05085 [Candidatus Aegiribacteria sp. MLS_C]